MKAAQTVVLTVVSWAVSLVDWKVDETVALMVVYLVA